MRLSIRTKLLATAGALLAFTGVVAGVGYFELKGADDNLAAVYNDQLLGLSQLASMAQDTLEIRSNAQMIAATPDAGTRANLVKDVEATDTAFTSTLQAAYAADSDGREKTILDRVTSTHEAWMKALRSGLLDRASTVGASVGLSSIEASNALFADAYRALQDAQAAKLDAAAATHRASQDAAVQANLVILVAVLLAFLVGGALALVLSRNITRDLHAVQTALTSMTDNCAASLENGLAALARNDLSCEVHATTAEIESHGSDEIGQTAAITNVMLAKLKATIQSYETARAGLSDTVGQVKAAAEALAHASDELNSAATQSGSASQQVAQTISQVAAGADDQARAATQTSAASRELTDIIERVGEGAASTQIRVEEATRALNSTTRAVSRALKASDEIAPLNDKVNGALAAGQEAVDETAHGMNRIKSTVDSTAATVIQLGAKSDQIGAIVETIDDIAEQTNLLALNAAIEAARAGEQGKGFAVVADEVRKLAERSGLATKEIAALISEVQTETDAAVKAMQVGAEEVATGAELADQASGALKEIRELAAVRNLVLDQILESVVEIRRQSTEVVAATDSIASIAAETNSSSASMSSAADVVCVSVDSIAAISEENSASAEEVSAATEEMSAQAEEVVASAATLSEMAQQLDELVARFRLKSSDAVSGNVIQRRRASDWQAPSEAARRTASA